MKLCLLTYDTPHLKTAQVFCGLLNRGLTEIDFLLMPFVKRPERSVIFRHRPYQFCGPRPQSLASSIGRHVFAYENWRDLLDAYSYFLVCGSNLIEPDFADTGKVLNVHSGLIPAVRGLDSFKWALLEGKPLGNTLHVIDREADAGKVLAHLPTPLFEEDDLQTLADRHYQNEIWMLINFDKIMKQRRIVPLDGAAPKMRMRSSVEEEMVRSFQDYKAAMKSA